MGIERTNDKPSGHMRRSEDPDHSSNVPSSRDMPAEPRNDTEREQRQAVMNDAGKTDQDDRDNVHGDGQALGLDK